ncbi:unnamed protein product [Albugo candida]|uniref:Uncharacterized protein n=1 Tax=Albugo candida TaxID=65357 RepID=A0A024FY12_9STRA|nr:unnamed protein product [Albugo candida]|eukprot:CCI39464.1 unnamed protein product [Albugo candida]
MPGNLAGMCKIISATSDRKNATLLGRGSSRHPNYKNIERALFSLVNPTSTEVISLRAFGLSTDWKHNFLIKNEEKDLDTPIQTLQGDSSIRCMIIPGASNDAVCRECLAMHSKWLAIRSYILYHNSRKFSAELIVFRSNFELKEIVSNCREKLRLNVISRHFNDCQIMDSIFPRHRELLEVHHLKDGLNEEQQMRTENTMDLNKIKQFWTSSCSIHFLEYTGNAACQRDPLYIYFCLPIHKLELYRMDPQKCVRCSAGDYFVIAECNDSNVRYQKKIGLFHRYESIVNIETYPKPSDFEVLDERMNNCIVLYYVLDRRVRCHQCMKKAFSTKYDPHILTKTSSLVDIAKLSSVLPAWSLQNLLTCHLHDRCARLQKVPYHFFSEHASFLSSDSSKSTGRDATMSIFRLQCPIYFCWICLDASNIV